MLDGAHMLLMVGPAPLPIPAPLPVVEAVQRVQVTRGNQSTGFQITFAVGKKSPLQLAMLPAGYFDPIVTRIVVVVTFRGLPTVLVDGIVTQQELSPSDEPGMSTLTLTGDDLSVLMDVVQLKLAYPGMPAEAQAATILARYAAFGVTPLIIPSLSFTKLPNERFDQQTGTDLQYLRGLASQSGRQFYLEPGPAPLQSLAYFGPDPRPVLPVPQPALSVNSDFGSNVESLSFSLNGLAKRLPIVMTFDPITKKIPIPIPVPPIGLRPPLGARLTPPSKVYFVDDAASKPPDELAQLILGLLTESSDAITASGSLNVLTYGHILQPNQPVGVRGAGIAYDGLYYVNSVSCTLRPGEFKQSFQLSRDGLNSLTPAVMP